MLDQKLKQEVVSSCSEILHSCRKLRNYVLNILDDIHNSKHDADLTEVRPHHLLVLNTVLKQRAENIKKDTFELD